MVAICSLRHAKTRCRMKIVAFRLETATICTLFACMSAICCIRLHFCCQKMIRRFELNECLLRLCCTNTAHAAHSVLVYPRSVGSTCLSVQNISPKLHDFGQIHSNPNGQARPAAHTIKHFETGDVRWTIVDGRAKQVYGEQTAYGRIGLMQRQTVGITSHFSYLTVALEIQHCLVPLILNLLAVCRDGKALTAGIKDYHVLVFGICPLVDVEASLQVQDFFGHRWFAAKFLLVLIILKPCRTVLRGRPQHEESPVHWFMLAEIAAFLYIFIVLRLGGLVLHGQGRVRHITRR